jgi:defect-in-organelle-trafficking protein DotC
MKGLKILTMACALGVASLANAQTADITTTNVSGDSAYWSGGNAAPRDLSREGIMSSNMQSWDNNSENTARLQSIQVAAASLGSQAGLAARTAQIQRALAGRAREFDRAFNFGALLLEPGFLPPVVSEGRNSYNQPNDNEARASDWVFKIERPARIVSATPTWRTYLLGNSTPAVRPDNSVLPKTKEEKQLWDEWAQKGWDEGARLADQNFEANLARLKQDFEGMVRFKTLYEQGLVSKPRLARANLGVTGGGDEMAINDRIIRVTEKAALDANKSNWSAPVPRTTRGD